MPPTANNKVTKQLLNNNSEDDIFLNLPMNEKCGFVLRFRIFLYTHAPNAFFFRVLDPVYFPAFSFPGVQLSWAICII